MSLRLHRSLQALILAALGLFLLGKIWSGSLFWYINQRFVFVVFLAAIGLLALARSVLPELKPAIGHDEHASAGEHPHGAGSGWGLVLLAVPLVLGVLVPARALGSAAIANKGLNTTAPLAAGGAARVQLDLVSTDRTVLDWVRAFNYAEDVTTYAGQPADVIGFVYHHPHLRDDEFLVSRFAVTCCSADATAIGLLVRWPQARALENDGWVRVRGPVEAATFEGRTIPLITAESLDGVAPPDQPYLFP